MKNFETLQVGKTYKNRKGELITIINKVEIDNICPFDSSEGRSYTNEGKRNTRKDSDYDLIELIEPVETTEDKPLTICEIDAEIKRLQELRKELDKSVEVSNEWLDNEIRVRLDGKYKNIGFWLNPTYNWELVADEHKCLVLVPTNK
jgi:hypothetical protein